MQFVRKYRRFITAAAILVLGLLIFYVFWHLQVAEGRQKSRSVYLNDVQTAATAPLAADGVISQGFEFNEPFHALGVVPVYSGTASGALWVTVYDEAGTQLAAAEGNAAETLSGSWAVFVFGGEVSAPGGRYRLEFSAAPGQGAPAPALAKSAEALAGWQLTENGAAAGGSICLLAGTDRIGGFLTRFYWAFALLGSLLLAGLYLLVAFKVAVWKLFAVTAGSLCLLFNMILPPYAAPDESMHINQAWSISSFFMGQLPYNQVKKETIRRASDQNTLVQEKDTTVFTYRELAENLFTTSADSTPTRFDEAAVGDYIILYWPTSLVITLCRLLGLGFVPTLFVGRLFNSAVYVLLTTLAVRFAPTGKSIFAAAGLLPMALHLGASYSRDNFTIALYLLYTSLCLYYIIEKPRLDIRDLAVLTVIIVFVSPAKIVYAPVCLLFLLIPWQKFCFRGKAMGRRAAYVLKALGVVVTFSHLYPSAYMMLRMVVLEMKAAGAAALPGAIGVSAAFAAADPALAVPDPDSIRFTVWDFFANTGQIFWMVVRTFFNQFTFYLESLVGGNLGYYSLPLNSIFVIACLFLLALALLPEPESPLLSRRQRLFGGGMVLGVIGLLLIGFITWTPTYYTEVYGIQGRYLLPALPLALCCLSGLGKGLVKTREMTRTIIYSFGAVNVFALLNAFLLILER